MTTALTRPRLSWRHWTIGFVACTAIGLLQFWYRYLEVLAMGGRTPIVKPLMEEVTAAWTAGLLILPVLAFVRRYPLRGAGWYRRLPLYLAMSIPFGLAHTTSMAAARSVLSPLAGLGAYDYGIMRIRYAMEYPTQLIVFTLIVASIHGVDHYRASRARELRTARLEGELARAELHNLRMQLDPHFLFNTLNTISAVMYEDVRAADRMLSRLADLLRWTMRHPSAQQVPLERELEFLGLYVEIMRARFGPALDVVVDVDSAALPALVPPLLLQPLVENAIRHGAPADGPARITVTGAVERGMVRIVVRDNGPGLRMDPAAAMGQGIGLSNTAARLAALYGEGHRFELRDAEGGGLAVRIHVPFRRAEGVEPGAGAAGGGAGSEPAGDRARTGGGVGFGANPAAGSDLESEIDDPQPSPVGVPGRTPAPTDPSGPMRA